ncbi:MAG: hypothetical protein AAF721_21910 [Myxococcota bacterium]
MLGVYALAGSACTEIEERQREIPVIDVAVGANVDIRLEWACQERDFPTVVRCLTLPAESFEDAGLRNKRGFSLNDPRSQGDDIILELSATEVGETMFEVIYSSGAHGTFRDRFKVRAAEVTRVDPEMRCDHREDGLRSFPMHPEAEITFRLQAYAGTVPLASGDLPLVEDHGPFSVDTLQGSDGFTTLRAPAEPGPYQWQPVGKDSAPIDLPVYDPADAGVALLEGDVGFFGGDDLPGVIVSPGYEGAPSCKHEGRAIGVVEVVAGACRPIADAFALEGPFALDLSEGPVRLPVSGVDQCTVVATDEQGRSTELEFAVLPWGESEPEGSGSSLSETPRDIGPPLDMHTGCRRATSVGAGTCDILDGAGLPLPNLACLSSWDWKVTHRDGTEQNVSLPANSSVGVGLRSELHAKIEYKVLAFDIGVYPPSDLVAMTSAGLASDTLGCVDENQATIEVIPSEAGNFPVGLSASNITKDKTVEVRARPIEATRYSTGGAGGGTSTGPDSESHVFVGVQTELTVAFDGADGEELFGTTPIWITTDDASAGASAARPVLLGIGEFGELSDAEIFTGHAPNTVTVRHDASDDEHRFVVVDVDAIATVEGLEAMDLEVGGSECVRPTPYTGEGDLIHGPGSTRAVLSLSGAPLLLDVTATSDNDGALCLIGYQPGAVDLVLSWGEAMVEAAWSVD